MPIPIPTRVDQERGCGWRKPGGLYLVADGVPSVCTLMPIPLGCCPTCSAGMKPARGWTTIDGYAIATAGGTRSCAGHGPLRRPCPLESELREHRKAGLIWIGGAFYALSEAWTIEANRLGVSRRISRVPRDLVIGETWVLVAHRDAIHTDELDENGFEKTAPGIFHAFKPSAIEYVCRGDESDDDIDRLRERGITPVNVVRSGEQRPLDLGAVS